MRLVIFFVLLLAGTRIHAQTFYKTPSGKRYHTARCRLVEHTSAAVSAEEIRRKGLGPCSICKPGAPSFSSTQSLMNKPRGAAVGERRESVQCRGTTQKGTRCKHSTRMADGYCAQHTPR